MRTIATGQFGFYCVYVETVIAYVLLQDTAVLTRKRVGS